MMKMEEDQELRFVCKLCNKKYPCGKSLGGHMRSHVIANSTESDEKVQSNKKNISSLGSSGKQHIIKQSKGFVDEFGNGQSSNYGLRENPKKTWRAVDSRQERICKQCGKVFQSMKALCGHMACHSDRDRGLKDDHSWTSDSDDRRRPRSSNCKRYKRIVVKSSSSFCLPSNGFSSSASDIEDQEQEDLAMCLMMLSRDSGNRGGVNSTVESSYNNSVCFSFGMKIDRNEGLNYVLNGDEDMKSKVSILDDEVAQMESSDSGYFLDECTKIESDVSIDGVFGSSECKKPLMNLDRVKSDKTELSRDYYNKENGSSDAKLSNHIQKRGKYECFNCKKTFNSYQALGGHRPCQKTSNAHFESRYETGLDDATYRKPTVKSSSQYAEKRIEPMQSKGHECPFCHRVFKNGQALGGHKKSHFIKRHNENSGPNSIKKPDLPHFIDLNLPAAAEEEEYGNGSLFAW